MMRRTLLRRDRRSILFELGAGRYDGSIGLRATKATGRGGRQRLEKVGRRALSKAAAYVVEQRDIQPTMYVHTSSGGTMPIVPRDLPLDEML
jgi:hypothetical protein